MPPKGTHVQKNKRGPTGGTAKNIPKPQSAQMPDIKEFFQHSQIQGQQEMSITAELNTSSPSAEIDREIKH